MFDKMHGMLDQLKVMQRMMKDENFRAFISHPKMQELLKDPEFRELMKSQDMAKLAAHPKFSSFLHDPELAELIKKIDPKKFMGHGV